MSQKSSNLRWLIALLISALTFLTGCVDYDVGINVQGQHQGSIVQRIALAEQFTNFSQAESQQWLKSIETRAKSLQGKVKRLAPNEIEVKIPFANGKELTQKFNQFFNPENESSSDRFVSAEEELLALNAHLSLIQSNLLLLERNKIDLTLDLTGLGVLSEEGGLIVSSGSLVNIAVALNTPWGAKEFHYLDDLASTPAEAENQLRWELEPGQVNHIEAVFWVPSYLGIGTVGIMLLVYVGYLARRLVHDYS